MDEIVPVILAGGAGTRLWPLSRKSYPKQFSNLLGDLSLYQQTALRLTSSKIVKFEPIITITGENFRFTVREQLEQIDICAGSILIEPEGRNTAPAILAASIYAMERNEDAILLVAPSDHIVQDLEAFHNAVLNGLNAAHDGKIVTFGVSPTRAETGYGYLELAAVTTSNSKAIPLTRFVEKPDKVNAKLMYQSGQHLWNAGIFLFRAKDMIKAFELHGLDYLPLVRDALSNSETDMEFLRLNKEHWIKCENQSVDYVIMENVKNLVVVPLVSDWSDLGGWDSVFDAMNVDMSGVVTSKNAHAIDCENTLLRSENEQTEIVGLGLQNIIAIAMRDAVLVVDKERAQDVKTILPILQENKVSQAETFPIDYRPWGWFETLTTQNRFQVKRIFVKPGAALSLQSHYHRSEHWIVVEGTAKVTLGEKEKIISEGESIYIPLGEKHRLENPGKLPMVLIEVQTGSYLGEDDIVRYDDIYKRRVVTESSM